jgi:BlaI family penicillinase repressor
MDVLYQRGRATAAEVHAALPDPPSYSAVRAKLRVLEDKHHVKHEEEALRYVYVPTVAPERARRSALRHMVDTFFNGSVEQVVAALIDRSAMNVSTEETRSSVQDDRRSAGGGKVNSMLLLLAIKSTVFLAEALG